MAHVYELSNALSAVIAATEEPVAPGSALARAFGEAAGILVQCVAPFMPHLAESCWAELGHGTPVAEAAWPEADRALVIENTVTVAVQINGKRRAEVTVPRAAEAGPVQAAALALPVIVQALDGRSPKKVIVVPGRIVNVVV